MPGPKWSSADLAVLAEEVAAGGTWTEVAKRVHARLPHVSPNRHTIMSRARRAGLAKDDLPYDPARQPEPPKDGAKVELDLANGTGTIKVRGTRGRSLQEEIDDVEAGLRREWRVVRVSQWEQQSKDDGLVTLYAFRVERRGPSNLERSLEELCARLRKGAPRIPKPRVPKDGCALYLGLHDAHFGLYAWGEEVGTSSDLKTQRAIFKRGAADLLAKAASFGVSEIVFPVGHDFVHIDNAEAVTPRAGNVLDVDGRYTKVMVTAEEAVVWAVEHAAGIAPVRVIWVPGNHDYKTSFAVCRAIHNRFYRTKHVEVDTSAPPRKYVRHGVNLLGLTHGLDEKMADLPTIMATERPDDWAASRHREWLIGHWHRKKQTRFVAGDTFNGVGVRVLPSLCGTDAWHFRKGFTHPRKTAEAYLYHEADGYVGHLSTTAGA